MIVPVQPNTSTSTFRTEQDVSKAYGSVHFHPNNSLVYFLGHAADSMDEALSFRYGAMWAITIDQNRKQMFEQDASAGVFLDGQSE